MSVTENLELTLPAGTDWADIAALNGNFELIDAAVGAAQSAADALTAHAASKGNPHGVTAAQTGAAAAGHTHTPGSIGAAAAGHTHTPGSIGAAAALTLTCTVGAGWTASGDFYYKQVSVPGMLAGDNPIADILPGGDNAANKLYAESWAKVQSIDTLNGAVKLWAAAAPATAFPVQFKVVR